MSDEHISVDIDKDSSSIDIELSKKESQKEAEKIADDLPDKTFVEDDFISIQSEIIDFPNISKPQPIAKA
jgi:hypothetical protein